MVMMTDQTINDSGYRYDRDGRRIRRVFDGRVAFDPDTLTPEDECGVCISLTIRRATQIVITTPDEHGFATVFAACDTCASNMREDGMLRDNKWTET